MRKVPAAVLCVVLALTAAGAGAAVGWAIGHDDREISIDVADKTWLVAALVAGVAGFVLLHLFSPRHFGEAVTWLLVAYLIGGSIVLGDLLISFWTPAQSAAAATGAAGTAAQTAAAKTVHLFGTSEDIENLDPTTIRLLLILISGAAGGIVNALWVFVARTGNASFRERWAWWYVAGPVFGAAAAFGLSLAFSGSLVEFDGQIDADAADVSLLAFIAFIAGLFSKAVFERLSRVLPRPTRRTGPSITSTTPAVIPVTSTEKQTVEIHGTGFTGATSVWFEGERLDSTKDGNKLTVAVDLAGTDARPITLEVVTEARHADAIVIPRE